jgi:hypothetical protein
MRALKLAFKPMGREWGDEYVNVSRPMVPERTGRLRKSIRVKNNTQRKTTISAHFTASFVDAGTIAHNIEPKRGSYLAWNSGGRTIFARKVNHPGQRAKPFRARAAREALRRKPLANKIIEQWNRAA